MSITFNIVCNAICFPKTITTNNAKRNDDLGPLGNIDVVAECALFSYNRCGAFFLFHEIHIRDGMEVLKDCLLVVRILYGMPGAPEPGKDKKQQRGSLLVLRWRMIIS